MKRFSTGDQFRIDIQDETDPDHDTYHGEHGTIIETLQDQAEDFSGDERGNII